MTLLENTTKDPVRLRSPGSRGQHPAHAHALLRFLVLITLWDLRRGPCSQNTWVLLGVSGAQGRPATPHLCSWLGSGCCLPGKLKIVPKENSRTHEVRTEPPCFWLKNAGKVRLLLAPGRDVVPGDLEELESWGRVRSFRHCIHGFNPAPPRGTSLCPSPGKQTSLGCRTPVTLQRQSVVPGTMLWP